MAGVCQCTYLVHSTYVFFCTRAMISLFRVKPTVLGNQGIIIVKPCYFYSRRCNIFDIFVNPIMLLVIYLANPRDIL
jgi:hypothetical protein